MRKTIFLQRPTTFDDRFIFKNVIKLNESLQNLQQYHLSNKIETCLLNDLKDNANIITDIICNDYITRTKHLFKTDNYIAIKNKCDIFIEEIEGSILKDRLEHTLLKVHFFRRAALKAIEETRSI